MDERGSRGSGTLGYVVVVIGVAAFVLSCFLPYVSAGSRSFSFYRLVIDVTEKTAVAAVGGFVSLFAGAGVVAWIALAGVRDTRHSRRWLPFALVASTAAWSLTWIGALLNQAEFIEGHRVGYWSLLASLGVAVVGAIVVWLAARARGHEQEATGGPEPHTESPVS